MKLLNKIILLLIAAGIIVIIRNSGLADMLTFERIKESSEVLQNYVSNNYLLSVVLFILVYSLSVAFSIPGASLLTMLGGFLYGTITGTIYVNIAATSGAFGVFLFARYLFGDYLQTKYRDRLAKFNKEIAENGYSYLLTLRLIPLFPFWMINIFAGLTNIPAKVYLWTTALGIIPGSLAYAFAGSQLTRIETTEDIFSGNVLIALLALAAISIIPAILKHLRKKKIPA
jgi:uncharacterized membrane protein YdjX (TVP38/TMEM64 family)